MVSSCQAVLKNVPSSIETLGVNNPGIKFAINFDSQNLTDLDKNCFKTDKFPKKLTPMNISQKPLGDIEPSLEVQEAISDNCRASSWLLDVIQ